MLKHDTGFQKGREFTRFFAKSGQKGLRYSAVLAGIFGLAL